MKKLKLSPQLKHKLNRLDKSVGELTFSGVDINDLVNHKFVAVVGTRKPTAYGKMMTEKLTQGLAREGVIIVSGLALGIDSLAHKACLDAGGSTIAVLPDLPTGYPATNRMIAERILEQRGALLTEVQPKNMPPRVKFLERNRIVATLCDAVVIPEATDKSGSLNTARNARELGIPVFAVPGNTTSPMSEGTNQLLKRGAKVVTEASDVLSALGINSKPSQQKLDLAGENEAETLILQKIAKGLNDPDTLQAETKLKTTELQTHLTMLEIQGKITQDSLGLWQLK